MANVWRNKSWFHSSSVKFPLVTMSASWFLVSMCLIWILETKLILSNNQIKSNSVGSGNVSHFRASSLYDHLDHCFVVFKHIQQSFRMRRFDVRGNKINIIQIIGHSLRLFFFWNCVTWWTNFTFVHQPVAQFLTTLLVFPRTATIRSHKPSAGILSSLNPASKEMISDPVELCKTKVCFLHIQLFGTNVWLPNMHNVPPEVDFESSRSHAKIGVLKQSQSALFGSITHTTKLFVITRMMNVWNQSIQTFVTSFGPFCDRSRKFVQWP